MVLVVVVVLVLRVEVLIVVVALVVLVVFSTGSSCTSCDTSQTCTSQQASLGSCTLIHLSDWGKGLHLRKEIKRRKKTKENVPTYTERSLYKNYWIFGKNIS